MATTKPEPCRHTKSLGYNTGSHITFYIWCNECGATFRCEMVTPPVEGV